ncbi:MAG: hypothetical protein M3008_11940 [Chloroflexota bacterium]|nr:hypothetical protein [Chloroflexota bacterium]
MVSQQPQNRSDTMAGSTPKPGASSSQGTSGGGTPSGAGQSSQTQTDIGAKAQDVVEQTQQKAGEVADQVKQQATSQLSSQKDRAVESLGTVADALRQTGKHLHENDQHGLEQYANKAAERVEQFSGQLRGKDVQEIVRDVERYARRQPALFLGGAFALGLLGARFLKSTAQREEDEGKGNYRYDRSQSAYGSGSYRGQSARSGQSGQYTGSASSGGYGTKTGNASGTTTGSATTAHPSTGGSATGTGERSWSVRGTETR